MMTKFISKNGSLNQEKERERMNIDRKWATESCEGLVLGVKMHDHVSNLT